MTERVTPPGESPRSEAGRIVTSTRVYEGRLLKIDREDVELPGGKTASLETIRHPGAAAALPFVDAATVILIRQFRHAVGGFIIEVPAGKLDPGEPPDVCVRREVAEEVGQASGRIVPLGSILTTPGFTDEVIWLYEAHDLTPVAQSLESDEVIEILHLPFAQAITMVQSGEIRDAKTVATILMALARRG